jgi:histidinol dehydrogenase
MMRRLSSADVNFDEQLNSLLAFETVNDAALVQTVDQIIHDVRTHGNAHVLKLTQQFDQHPAQTFAELELTQESLKTAFDQLTPEIRQALELAAARIRSFHTAQKLEIY